MKSIAANRQSVTINKHKVTLYTSPLWSAERLRQKPRYKEELSAATTKANHTSISHTRRLGGFAHCKTAAVGFDLEPVKRKISPAAYRRVATHRERATITRLSKSARAQQLTQPLALWVIKEAAWKALKGPKQPKTISQIEIVEISLHPRKNQLNFSFKSSHFNSNTPLGRGSLIKLNRIIAGIAVYIS